MTPTIKLLLSFLILITLSIDESLYSQSFEKLTVDTTFLDGMKYRMVGPYRGGRSTAVAGYPNDPFTFLMGGTGGGVWKSNDAGGSWTNITDEYFGGGIGAITIAPSDPNIIFVGTGSADPRGNISAGRGIYKSDDNGKSWKFSGLPEAGQIGKIRIHPHNPDLIYVAALGHIFGPNQERGVYRSKDGGETWDRILTISDTTGAVSLSMNPKNPREIYAGMWRAERKPWTMISGSTEGGIYKTMDGGDTWKKLGGGLPSGMVGKTGVSISPANPDRAWVIIEAEPEGGVYRTDDAGITWKRVNKENKLRQRAWYYTHVIADPSNQNTVYALNTRLYRSVDGGKTFEVIPVPHGDVHDLWINPNNPDIMIVADDGGAQVTLNGGESWSTYMNQPTAELYGVVVDNGFPYRLYGAQQDNTTISVPSWTDANRLHAKQNWYSVGGCETGPIALNPNNPDIIYAGCYGGVMDKFDKERQQVVNVMSYPQLQLGEAAKNLKYRFQWVSPMAVSPHDENEIYHGSQYVHRSKDGGNTWEVISPDLSTNTPEHLEYSGGPINHDITGVEISNVVFEIFPSPHATGEVWAGTDDGRVHITRDDGATWQEITPPDMPKYGTVNKIDLSGHQAGKAFMAVQKYRFDDFTPYIFMTDNYGKTWKKLTNEKNGIPIDHTVRVVREDPDRKGLLYAGTEYGMYVSFDEGRQWQSFQINLPIVPITDMRVHQKDLVLSTQGRSFWILDDISPLHELDAEKAKANIHLFSPRSVYKIQTPGGSGGISGQNNPQNRPNGATIYYSLQDTSEAEINLSIFDSQGRRVRLFSTDSTLAKTHKTPILKPQKGLNRVTWDLTYEGPTFVEGTVIWGYQGGVKAPPGNYEIMISHKDVNQTQSIEVLADPRIPEVSQEDYEEQLKLGLSVRNAINEIHSRIKEIKKIKTQVRWMSEQTEDEAISVMAKETIDELSGYEQILMQTKNQSNQDPIRFAPKLDNQYVELYNYITGVDGYISGGREGKPPLSAYQRLEDVKKVWTELNGVISAVLSERTKSFNELVRSKNIIGIKEEKP
jgi:photosystem II stability/assembly factor-like uncharacterized protein